MQGIITDDEFMRRCPRAVFIASLSSGASCIQRSISPNAPQCCYGGGSSSNSTSLPVSRVVAVPANNKQAASQSTTTSASNVQTSNENSSGRQSSYSYTTGNDAHQSGSQVSSGSKGNHGVFDDPDQLPAEVHGVIALGFGLEASRPGQNQVLTSNLGSNNLPDSGRGNDNEASYNENVASVSNLAGTPEFAKPRYPLSPYSSSRSDTYEAGYRYVYKTKADGTVYVSITADWPGTQQCAFNYPRGRENLQTMIERAAKACLST